MGEAGVWALPRAYPSDLTDAQWALIEPLVPVRSTRGKGTAGGRPAKYPRRRIVDAILYLNRTGCSWRQLPHDFPPWETVFYYFQRWGRRWHHRPHPRRAARRRPRRRRSGPGRLGRSGGLPDRARRGHRRHATRGWDAGKKTNGRKRHLVVDTMGLLVAVLVTAASVQDRDSGIRVLDRTKMGMPSLALVWADAAYSRRTQDFATRALRIAVQVVAKLVGQSASCRCRAAG